ncbi:MAG: hypothetical protein IKO26_08365 [Paludibacteraceae bacterium]|nr:hypothetical protein [Paludibacteraceae bacterium]
MTNRDWQKYGERFALHILTDKLNVPREKISDYESPDFIFEYKGKTIGAEVVEYHKNPRETEARKAFQKAIDKYRSKNGKLTSVIVFAENLATFNVNVLPLHRGLDNMCTNMSFALGKNTL